MQEEIASRNNFKSFSFFSHELYSNKIYSEKGKIIMFDTSKVASVYLRNSF